MTVTIERTVTVDRPLSKVFDYLSDFTTTNDWDAGTVETVRVGGDGGVGTTYRNVTKLLGWKTEQTYVVDTLVPQELFVLRAEKKSATMRDTMSFRETPEGTQVTYRGDFDFKGPTKYAALLLRPVLNKLFDDGAKGIREALERL